MGKSTKNKATWADEKTTQLQQHTTDNAGSTLNTNQGLKIADNQN